MTDIKMQARNKFANKISQKIDKLNNDIQLLIQVDQVFKTQSGGAPPLLSTFADAIMNKTITHKGTPTLDTGKLKTEADKLASDLQTKIDSLETTLKKLIAALEKSQEIDISKVKITVPTNNVLDEIKAKESKLETVNTNVDSLIKFNQFYETATTKSMDNSFYKTELENFGLDRAKNNELTNAINKIRTNSSLPQFTYS